MVLSRVHGVYTQKTSSSAANDELYVVYSYSVFATISDAPSVPFTIYGRCDFRGIYSHEGALLPGGGTI